MESPAASPGSELSNFFSQCVPYSLISGYVYTQLTRQIFARRRHLCGKNGEYKRSDWREKRETRREINLVCAVRRLINLVYILLRSQRAAKFWLRLRKWYTVCYVISRRKCVLFGETCHKKLLMMLAERFRNDAASLRRVTQGVCFPL